MSNECFLHAPPPVRAFRLGPKDENKVRPVKIKFNDEVGKWNFVKRVNQQFKKTSMFCLLDRSKEIRDSKYKLRQTAKSLGASHGEMNFVLVT